MSLFINLVLYASLLPIFLNSESMDRIILLHFSHICHQLIQQICMHNVLCRHKLPQMIKFTPQICHWSSKNLVQDVTRN
jgi:hypothetical protein